MTKMTPDNLRAALAGESQASVKYAIFADQAETEGYPQVARLFRAISFAERVHAQNHLRELGGIGDASANLQTARDGENYEVVSMYPAFNAVAKLEKDKGAMLSIHYALEAEKIHEQMYGDAKHAVDAKKDIAATPIYICPVCGYTVIGEPPDKCPISGTPKAAFIQF